MEMLVIRKIALHLGFVRDFCNDVHTSSEFDLGTIFHGIYKLRLSSEVLRCDAGARLMASEV